MLAAVGAALAFAMFVSPGVRDAEASPSEIKGVALDACAGNTPLSGAEATLLTESSPGSGDFVPAHQVGLVLGPNPLTTAADGSYWWGAFHNNSDWKIQVTKTEYVPAFSEEFEVFPGEVYTINLALLSPVANAGQEDGDGDTVGDTCDNCPSDVNPGQENNVHNGTPEGDHCEDPEPDGVFDIGDNCPDAANPGQENAVHPGTYAGDHCEDPDRDGVVDLDDNCPDTSTPWLVPVGDADCDAFTDAAEASIGTNASIACGYTPLGDPASETWPPDLTETNDINIVDVLALKPVFGTAVPPTSPRYDLAPSGQIDIVDVLQLKPFFGAACTP